MKRIEFIPPSGEVIKDPTFPLIKNLILNKGKDFWESGSGDACISITDDEGYMLSEIILMVREYGVFIQYGLAEDGSQYNLITSNNTQVKTTINLSGEPWELPISFFVEKDIAIDAVSIYLNNSDQEMLRKFKWKLL